MTKTNKFLTPNDLGELEKKYGVVNKNVLEMEGFTGFDMNFKIGEFIGAMRKGRSKGVSNSYNAPLDVNNRPKGAEQMKTTIDQTKKEQTAAFNNELQDKKKRIKNQLNQFLRTGTVATEFKNALTLTQGGAVLIPEELKGDIEAAKKFNKSMRQYVHVVPVKDKKGLYTTEDEGNFSELIEFSDSVPITEADMQFRAVNWNLKRYGSFTKVSEELFNDTGFDLTTTFVNAHSEKATKTENKLIFTAIRNGLTVKALTDVESLKTSLNKDLNPALENEIVVVTNQDGLELFNKLDSSGNTIKYLKTGNDAEGPKRFLDIYRFEVYSNEELPSQNGKAPFIYGTVNREVKLFTTDSLETLVNKKAGLLNSTYFVRGIEDYDVQVMPNATQLIYGEIPLG